MPLFVTSFVKFSKIFVKPLITSCQICHFPKNRQLSTCHFLSSHFNIWPKPWWIFGILVIFAEICLYRLNLPFSYNRYLYKIAVFVFSFKFCQSFDGFFQKFFGFVKHGIFVKNPQLMASFFCHLVLIFAKPLINSCQTRSFHQSCFLANYQQAIFPDLWWILAKFANFATFVFFVKPTTIDMPVLSSCFNFYQTFYKFLPNLSFS